MEFELFPDDEQPKVSVFFTDEELPKFVGSVVIAREETKFTVGPAGAKVVWTAQGIDPIRGGWYFYSTPPGAKKPE
jgi:hypothetical protein